MTDSPITPAAALRRLLDGNRRFQGDCAEQGSGVDRRRRLEVAAGQQPFAAVLCCADSRVAPSLVFDAGLGDLFTCRNAGNQVDALTVGSLEYAVAHCDCRLVAILGHSGCGAVTATVEACSAPDRSVSPYVDDIVRRLLPAVLAARTDDVDGWVDAAARRNVQLVRRDLLSRSQMIRDACASGRVGVAGLWYDLHAGVVTELDAPEG
jgi:carbonic anhydrase